MNFKKLMVSVMSAGLVVSMGVSTSTVYGAEGENNVAGSAESEVKVQFVTPKEGGAEVLDPEDMNEPLSDADGKGDVTGDKGLLSLDYVSNIAFGEQEVSHSAQTYHSVTKAPFIQVTDQRGTGDGWEARAEAKGFKEVDEEGNPIADSLKGATITLSNGIAKSPITPNGNYDQTPDVKNPITLVTDNGEVNIATAKSKEAGKTIDTAQGVGTWLISWMTDEEINSNVELYVPARSASVGTHIGTIEWTLNNGPGTRQ